MTKRPVGAPSVRGASAAVGYTSPPLSSRPPRSSRVRPRPSTVSGPEQGAPCSSSSTASR